MTKYPISDHCDGNTFFDPSGSPPRGFRDLVKWKLSQQRKPWPKWVETTSMPMPALTTNDNDIVLTFINHVTFLIQTGGMNIVTDPVFSKRVSPLKNIGPKRVHAPGMAIEQLPPIDLVLVSHNHYDHMDLPSIRQLVEKFNPVVVTPLGNNRILKKTGANNIIEMDWWENTNVRNLQVTTVPAQHWSARGFHDRNLALWGGFVLQTPQSKIYFAGDTGYGPHFKRIHQQLGVMDLALLPIGAYKPRWFMREQHMNPEDAIHAHIDLQAAHSIAMHYGTFQLTDEGYEEPLQDLEVARQKYHINNFSALNVGETRQLNKPVQGDGRWCKKSIIPI